jgi:hypothetical protein
MLLSSYKINAFPPGLSFLCRRLEQHVGNIRLSRSVCLIAESTISSPEGEGLQTKDQKLAARLASKWLILHLLFHLAEKPGKIEPVGSNAMSRDQHI